MDDLLVFRRFRLDEDDDRLFECQQAAIDKLQTLYPGKRITRYDDTHLGIESDSLYAENGIDVYELGLVDEYLPAMRNTRDDSVITFRV